MEEKDKRNTDSKETRRIVTKRETQSRTVGCCWLEHNAVVDPTPIYRLLMNGASLYNERSCMRQGY